MKARVIKCKGFGEYFAVEIEDQVILRVSMVDYARFNDPEAWFSELARCINNGPRKVRKPCKSN